MLAPRVAAEVRRMWHRAHVELPWGLQMGCRYTCCSGGAGARGADMCTSPGTGVGSASRSGGKMRPQGGPGMTECGGGLGL